MKIKLSGRLLVLYSTEKHPVTKKLKLSSIGRIPACITALTQVKPEILTRMTLLEQTQLAKYIDRRAKKSSETQVVEAHALLKELAGTLGNMATLIDGVFLLDDDLGIHINMLYRFYHQIYILV